MTSVLQPWMEKLPIRMQATLINGLRGPDTHRCPEIKKIIRWLRGLCYKPGNPNNFQEFMAEMNEVPPIIEKTPIARELEFSTIHFYSHLMHALEVVGYCHPTQEVASLAYHLFQGMCSLLHLPIEDIGDFRHRLRQIDWPGNNPQPDTFEEAVQSLEIDREKIKRSPAWL